MARSGVLNVYIEEFSPRAKWIFHLMLEDLLGLQLKMVDEIPDDQPILNYSTKEIPGSLTIIPHGLLSEKDIRPQEILMGEYQDDPVFFMQNGGDLPFDPFAMAFYLVSRYEEYLPFKADAHGRFPHTESLAYKEGFLHLAIVNRIAFRLKEILGEKFPELEFHLPEYQFFPTVDIDIAFAHLGKGFVRTYGAMLKLLLKGDLKEIGRRFRSMQGKADDPYDNFAFLLESFSTYGYDPVFFVLAGDPGPYDRNLSTGNKKFAELIKDLSNQTQIGIHPSYGAGNNIERINKEIRRIDHLTGKQVEKSRQHFVKMSFPDTYEALLEAGISKDYSMGYASYSGFRAGIASSFNFYNLKTDQETSLQVYPFMFMDTTLDDYLSLEPEAYLDAVAPMIEEVKAVRGTLIGIWHNYALADNTKKHKAMLEILSKASIA